MARPINKHTATIRQAVTNWIARTNPEYYNVPMLITALSSVLSSCHGVDLGKALSNELTRREALGLVESTHSEVVGVGRPPKMYRQLWRM